MAASYLEDSGFDKTKKVYVVGSTGITQASLERREREKERDMQADRQTVRLADIQADRQTNGQGDRKAVRETG